MTQELVSVIMPSYNSSEFISESVESILNQTYKNLEVIITDDHSTDGKTLELLKHYQQKDGRVRVFHLPSNCGSGAARNNSIKEARGRYIAFCDSDDCWMPEKLATQIAYMEEHQCPFTCTSYIVVDEKGRETGYVRAPKIQTTCGLIRNNTVGCLTAVYDTQMLGGKFYMPTLRKRQDWACFISIAKECKTIPGLQLPLARYRVRPQSISRSKYDLVKYNIAVYREVLGFSKMKARLFFTFCFMPSYTIKKLQNRYDSYKYLKYGRV